MSDRLKFKRVHAGLWRNGTYHVEKRGSKWNVIEKGRVVCEAVKDLTAASACIVQRRKKGCDTCDVGKMRALSGILYEII